MQCIQSDYSSDESACYRLLLLAAVSRMSFLNCGEKIRLSKKLDNIDELALLSKNDVEQFAARPIKSRFENCSVFVAEAERDLKLMEKYGIRLVCYEDAEYPALLREIPQPPFCLYYRGSLNALKNDCIGIVGTRHPDGSGLEEAFKFAKDCASAGVSVVSGLAAGIDAAAHKGAVSVSADKTAAVCGCGVDTLYPAVNKKLAYGIISGGGCIMSEYPPGTPPEKWRFPERNRIISGLSKGVCVIEAPGKSGALITVEFALEQGRDVCFHSLALDFSKRLEKNIKNEDDVFKSATGVQRYIAEGAPVFDNAQKMLEFVLRSKTQQSFDFGFSNS